MSFLLLTNTVGAMASECVASGAALVGGYSVYDAISGPRNRTVRATASGLFSSVIYHGPSTTTSHVVVTSAHLFKNATGADEVRLEYGTGGVLGFFNTVSTTAAADMDLVGVAGQDWVTDMAATGTTFQALFANTPADTYETEFGKVYFSTAFDFGTEPQKQVGMQGQRAQKDAMVQPLVGWEVYAVTNSFSLTFRNVSPAKMREFETLPINFPLFYHDEDGDVFPHKLEHAIVTGWESTRGGVDRFDVTIQNARLKHY